MKGVIVLLLVVGAIGNPVTLTQFFTGYNQGLESSETCFENPEMCGEFLGEFVGVLGELLNNPSMEELIGGSTRQAQLFILGLVAGLTRDNTTVTKCMNDFAQSNYQLASLCNAIKALISNGLDDYIEFIQFACSGASMVTFEFLKDCQFGALWKNIQAMTLDRLVDTYMKNNCDLNAAAVGLLGCNNDLSWCGHNIGVIVREVFDWGI